MQPTLLIVGAELEVEPFPGTKTVVLENPDDNDQVFQVYRELWIPPGKVEDLPSPGPGRDRALAYEIAKNRNMWVAFVEDGTAATRLGKALRDLGVKTRPAKRAAVV